MTEPRRRSSPQLKTEVAQIVTSTCKPIAEVAGT